MEIRFMYAIKVTLCLLCVIYVIILMWNINFLNSITWHFLPVGLTGNKLKYILLWTNPDRLPFSDIGEGRSGFVYRNCRYTNCIVTGNRNLLGDVSLFDAILFHAPEAVELSKEEFPKKRSPHQKYVFACIESADNYPICSTKFDGYFNWTWTYRLDSDLRWGYIVIRNSIGKIVGPKKKMHWVNPNKMAQVDSKLKEKLKSKTRAAAWFVSNCITNSRREGFALALDQQLRRYGLELDIYGNCDKLKCPRSNETGCNKMLSEKYYFYLSFENSLSEDYVTEKLLKALNNDVVPIVYGGADYSRFLPPGSYLNARELGLYLLVEKMRHLMEEPELYAQYFRWRNHYSYHKTIDDPETNEYCQMCALLNSHTIRTKSVYKNLYDWWDPTKLSQSCLTRGSFEVD
ncbi:alpha-(1,3)-fucosyltransferase C-like [Anticarsia gemmatalis]|uniref:alpha-(1,3)-fucosyltransferase C-like n=1 Tax=Anticarsia gemmatalis TaxID=129554 RepID=UPI003F772AA6